MLAVAQPHTEEKNKVKKTILITGGCGFIGSNFIQYMRGAHPDCKLINLDTLTYSGNLENLKGLNGDTHYLFLRGDITDEQLLSRLFQEYSVEAVVHFAAETHVDRSILSARPFAHTNVVGTCVLLEAARHHWTGPLAKDPSFRFVHISTDEVYGTLGKDGLFTEESPLRPNSPYSASKTGADLLVRSYFETYGLPVLIARPSNNYGPYQYPEKFIPLMITNLMEGMTIPVYGRGENISDWIYVTNTCAAIDHMLQQGTPGEAYNVGGESEKRNIDLAREILSLFHKGDECLTFVQDRPGHDFRYALDNSKIKTALGWTQTVSLQEGIERTVNWYRENVWWWKPLKEQLARESEGFWSKK